MWKLNVLNSTWITNEMVAESPYFEEAIYKFRYAKADRLAVIFLRGTYFKKIRNIVLDKKGKARLFLFCFRRGKY